MESKAELATSKRESTPDRRPVVRCPKCGLVQFWPEGKSACNRPTCRFVMAYGFNARLKLEPETGDKEPRAAKAFDDRDFAARLRGLRKARGWSQRELAERIKTRRTHISKIECSACCSTIKVTRRIAGALGIEIELLMDERFSLEDLMQRTKEDLLAREAFLAEIAELLPGMESWNLRILEQAAKAMAAGQYTLPEWMQV